MYFDKVLEQFYKKYDYEKIKREYRDIRQKLKSFSMKKLYKVSPFKLEVRMKDDVFAMQLLGEGVLNMELVVIMGFFFENYSTDKNCVWTKNKGNITRFFHEGTNFLRSYGGEIKISIDMPEREKIVKMLVNRFKEEEMAAFKDLCESFTMLEKHDWGAYLSKIKAQSAQKREEEHIQSVTCMDLPMDWENVFAKSPVAAGVYADSIPDGLILSMVNLGRVDIEYIAQVTRESYKAVITALKGSIYQNPDTWDECFYKGWESAEEYLSGRIRPKLKSAREANKKYKGYFEDNVKALEAVLPDWVPASDIYVTLGSPWVPTDIIDRFIEHLFGRLPSWYNMDAYAVRHDEITGAWEVPYKARYGSSVSVSTTYGTSKISGMHILEQTLNLKPVVITREVSTTTTKSGKKKVIDKDATVLAQEKQQAMIKEFQKWVWKDKYRESRLEEIFDEKFGSNIVRKFDGSFLTFPGMSGEEKLFDYQKNAVARILFTPNTLLAHDVGSGKTFIMAAAGMELKRMGISKKNLYVVPNNIVGQWKDMFARLYPEANILCVEPKSFPKNKRESVLADIRDGEFDAIIMAYSCFGMIPVSDAFYKDNLTEELEKIKKLMAAKKRTTARLEKKKAAIEKELEKIEYEELQKELCGAIERIYFQDMGITTLFVDEAHNFKNLATESQIENVFGLSRSGSVKCKDMLDKVLCVQKANGGRGVVMATGTPITNSLTDIYVMQRYLQSGELALLDLQSFDSWVGMFAESKTEFEIDVDTTQYRMATRFSKFHNLPELSNLLSTVADFHKMDKENGIPDFDSYDDVVVEKTSEFKDYLTKISKRASDVRRGAVKRTKDNMLKITTDGRKAALDMRLVEKNAVFTYQSKVAFCAENVFNIYIKTYADKSTQLVFCDTSTPKMGFNMYDELKELLVDMGIDEEKIAFIHDAETEAEKKLLFRRVQDGEVRVLIGSTFKLGLGVNVQDRLVALHHLDVPWRPSDMVQREGRILRQGNTNKKVWLYRYITSGSFDAYSWQLLESKQKMIAAILSGCANERSCQDVDDTVLSYAEVKALAIGDPLIKKRVETANELARTRLLQRQFVYLHQRLEAELLKMPAMKERQMQCIESCMEDMAYYEKEQRDYTEKERKEIRTLIYKGLGDNVLESRERRICTYQGFGIILPANMIAERPFVYIEAKGRYALEMGNVEAGVLVRIDNFLKDFEKQLSKMKRLLADMEKREAEMQEELKKPGYGDKIEELTYELEMIDKQLGVKTDE